MLKTRKEKDAEIGAIKASLSRYKTEENSKNGFDEWFSNNKFLDRLSPVKRKGKEIVSVDDSVRFGFTSETELEEIRADFAKIPLEYRIRFVEYQLLQFGTSPSTSNGSFFSLFDIDTRISIQESFKKAKEAIAFGSQRSADLSDLIRDSFIPNKGFNKDHARAYLDGFVRHLKLDEYKALKDALIESKKTNNNAAYIRFMLQYKITTPYINKLSEKLKTVHNKNLIRKIARDAIKLVLNDIIDNNVTF